MQAYPKRNGSYEITKKIKFALDRDTLQKKINSLDDATKMLSRIRENSSSRTGVVVHSSGSSGRRYVSSFDTIRKHAWRLYSALAVIYTKGCHPMHGANLFLESRADLLDRKHQTMKKKPVTFTLSFDPVGHTDSPSSSLAMEIKAWENDTSLSPSRWVHFNCAMRLQSNMSLVQDLSQTAVHLGSHMTHQSMLPACLMTGIRQMRAIIALQRR